MSERMLIPPLLILFVVASVIVTVPANAQSSTDAQSLGLSTPPEWIVIPDQLSRTLYGFWPYWISSSSYRPSWGNVTHVAYFDLKANSDGSLDTSKIGSDYYSIRDMAYSYGIKVVLAVTCFDKDTQDSILAYHKVALVRNITYAVQHYGADGVVLDFEFVRTINSLTGKSNVWYIEWLINYLHDELKKINPDYHIGFAVTGSVEKVYRNANLSRYVDAVFLMGYDYHWAGAPNTGAVAPFDDPNQFDVTDSMSILLNYYPREKIILGAPLYGYDWPASSTSPGASTLGTGKAVLVKYAVPNAQSYGRHWDANSHTPYYYYSSSDGHWHQCWYDDNESLDLKFSYANREGLSGGGFWALGYEGTSDVWKSIWDMVDRSLAVPNRIHVKNVAKELEYSITGHSQFLPGGTGSVSLEINNPTGEEKRVVLAAVLLSPNATGEVESYGWGFNMVTVPAGSTSTATIYLHLLGDIQNGTYNLSVYRILDGEIERSDVNGILVGWELVNVSPRFSYTITAPSTLLSGEKFQFNVTVRNEGDPVIHNVTVTLALPDRITAAGTLSQSWAFLDPATPHLLYGLGVDHTFSWNLTAVKVGTYEINVTIYTDDGGRVVTSHILQVNSPTTPPKVVINEIMYHPSEGDDSYGEWVELYNPNDISVDLGGWWIGDSDGGYTFPSGTTIPAHGFIVVARNSTWVLKSYHADSNFDAVALYGNATFKLDDAGDTVALKSTDGSIVDSVTYNPSWGGDGNGKSLERLDLAGDSNDPTNWAESNKEGGTPTYQNTVAVPFINHILTVIGILLSLIILAVR